jgi:hypothetical protein
MQQNIQQRPIDHHTIAARAYELYQARGGEPGHEMEDWLCAEAELRRAPVVEKPAEPQATSAATTVKPAKRGNGRK